MFVRLSCLLLLVAMSFLSPLAKAADPAFDSNTGKLALTGLSFNGITYGITLELVDPVALTFRVDMTSVKPAAAGASVQGVFYATTGLLFLPRVQVGSAVYNIQFKLIDASTMVFQLVRETLQLVSGGAPGAGGSGASSPPQGQLTNNFKSLYGGFIPSVTSEVGIRIPGDATYQQTPWLPIKLPETDMQIAPVPGTTSEVIVYGQFVQDKMVSNCRASYRFHINLRDSQPKRLSLTGSPGSQYSGSYINIQCNTPVTSNNRSWTLTLNSMVTGGLDVGLTLDMTGDSTGEATLSVKGEAKVPAMLLSGTSLLNYDAVQFGDSEFAIDSTTNLKVLADGSVTANGVQVKAPTSGTGGTGTSTGGGSGGGSTTSCVNSFTVTSLDSYYSGNRPAIPFAVTATGSTSPMEGGKAILLTANQLIETVPRFRLQIMIPNQYLKQNTFPVRDDQNNPGFDPPPNNGAIARLVYSIGKDRSGNEVNDNFWSNKDWGSQRARAGLASGTITISSMLPKITGTFTDFQLPGDGTSSQNTPIFATVANGTFCVDP